MFKYRPVVNTFAIVMVAMVAAAFLLGANLGSSQNPSVNVDRNSLPRVQVVEFDDGPVRFDSQTGSIMRFSGSLSTTSAAGSWVQSVQAVKTNTSGFLQLQNVGDATFLVDVVTGDTWVLRRFASTGAWQKIKALGS